MSPPRAAWSARRRWAAAGTLDVADGTIDVGNPFTATTLAQYNNVLTNQIWFTIQGDASAITSNILATPTSTARVR